MSEESQSTEQQEKELPRAGERLAAARRDKDISLRDIAKELHLDETKVQALEQNQFDTLGAPVFAKGHLRKYAELVGVPVDDILTDYYQLNRSVGAPPVVGPPRKVAREIDLTRYIMPVFVLLVLAGLAVWWLRSGSPLPSFDLSGRQTAGQESAIELAPRPQPMPAPAAIEPAAEPTEESPAVDTAAPAARPEAESNASTPQPAPSLDASVASSQATPRPAPTGPQVEVVMTYSGDCWTEVTDASGSRLFFDLGRDGRAVRVSGTAPLRVLFGSYANVSVQVDGRPFPIPASARRGETARFTINAR